MEKLLIVDDDAALRRLMRLELSDTYEVIDSGEPEQGLAHGSGFGDGRVPFSRYRPIDERSRRHHYQLCPQNYQS